MSVQTFLTMVVQGFKSWVYPRLTELPTSKWDDAIQEAQAVEFDVLERMALILSVVAATYLLRTEAGSAPSFSLAVVYLFQFIEAAFLLILFAGPFYLRRIRRGLDLYIVERDKKRELLQ